MAELGSAAMWYAEHGLAVFALQPGTKVPYRGSHGVLDATTNTGRVAQIWAARPLSNIGIATGNVVDVIDIDGPIGVHSWANSMHWPEPVGIVSTPRVDGIHLYVPANPYGRNRAGIFPGIDYRARGGYVVAPPSVLDTAPDRPYRWRRPIELGVLR